MYPQNFLPLNKEKSSLKKRDTQFEGINQHNVSINKNCYTDSRSVLKITSQNHAIERTPYLHVVLSF